MTGGGSEQERDNQRMRLAAAAAEIDELSRHLDYEAATSANMARGLRRLRQHMLVLLPLLESIEDRRIALGSDEEASAPWPQSAQASHDGAKRAVAMARS